MSELRQRKNTLNQETIDKTQKYVEAIADKTPAQVQPYLQKAAPHIGKIAAIIEMGVPLIYDNYIYLKTILEPHRVDLLFPAFVGLIMCFFGGSYMTLIAAAEAYRMCGYEETLRCISSLHSDFVSLKIENVI